VPVLEGHEHKLKEYGKKIREEKKMSECKSCVEKNKRIIDLETVVNLAPKCICGGNDNGIAVINFSNDHIHSCKVYRKALKKLRKKK
jgi:hypothetical protein